MMKSKRRIKQLIFNTGPEARKVKDKRSVQQRRRETLYKFDSPFIDLVIVSLQSVELVCRCLVCILLFSLAYLSFVCLSSLSTLLQKKTRRKEHKTRKETKQAWQFFVCQASRTHDSDDCQSCNQNKTTR